MRIDKLLQQDLIHELHDKRHVYGREAGVDDDSMTLKGAHLSRAERIAAEGAAGNAAGFGALTDGTGSGYGPAREGGDDNLAATVLDLLRSYDQASAGKISIRVSAGCVYLEGEVDWPCQRSKIGKAVWNVKGVKGISNRLRLNPVKNVLKTGRR